MTSSCTDALEMSALLLDINPGDSVIVPSFTFTSTALAFQRAGAKIRFADIEMQTLGICPSSVKNLLDETVKAVICVHYGGIPCDINGLREALKNWPNACLIEDNAHGLLGSYRGQTLGTFGRFSTVSFHETKNFHCGEGGALIVNESHDVEKGHIIYDKGTNRQKFLLGEVDKYTWVGSGSSFGMSELQAAFLWAQLEHSADVLKKRSSVFLHYDRVLRDYGEKYEFRTPYIPELSTSGYHNYFLLTESQKVRDNLLNFLRKREVFGTFHYIPLHSSPAGMAFGDVKSACPNSEVVSRCLIRLPFFTSMTPTEIDMVSALVIEFFESNS